MSKLDELIEQLESPQPFERALVLAELRRIQARERRYRELEASWRESIEAHRKSPTSAYYIARSEGLEIAADQLGCAIREET